MRTSIGPWPGSTAISLPSWKRASRRRNTTSSTSSSSSVSPSGVITARCSSGSRASSQRHHSCVQELRLGRRLAATVYLDVVPLVAGPRGFGDRLVAGYLERSGDRVPPALFALYHNQHAVTRALIALRHLDDATHAEQPRWRAAADQYLVRGVPV